MTGQSTIDTSVKTPPAPAPLGLSAQGQVALDTCTAAATASPSTADGAAFTKAILGCLAPYISDGTIDANYLSLQAVAPDCYIAVNALVAANATGAEISAGYSTADLCATKRLQTTP